VLRLEDPTNNRGAGWKQLTKEELVDLIYIGLKLARRSHRLDLTHRDASKADAAAKTIAKQLVERLRQYPVFGPERPASAPTCGPSGGSTHVSRRAVPLGTDAQSSDHDKDLERGQPRTWSPD
jgi:hypothetical protein